MQKPYEEYSVGVLDIYGFEIFQVGCFFYFVWLFILETESSDPKSQDCDFAHEGAPFSSVAWDQILPYLLRALMFES